jgi:uncharacterized protein YjbJ (UPF0337 family)/uncharacterized membrane protein (UPF0127 family)
MQPRRFRGLPVAVAMGVKVPAAERTLSRLLGLALLRRRRAGTGLLIPRCAAIHSFGMRFDLDVTFLDGDGVPVRRVPRLAPHRFAACRGAAAVLETPARCVYPAGPSGTVKQRPNKENSKMSIIDKLTGRAKKAAGDLAGDGSLKRQGAKEEKKGEAKEDLGRAQDVADDKADEVADLERKT